MAACFHLLSQLVLCCLLASALTASALEKENQNKVSICTDQVINVEPLFKFDLGECMLFQKDPETKFISCPATA